jgi:hypothetical protein
MTGRLWFLNALGIAILPITSISSLWVPLAFEQGMNVIQSFDILRPGALSSVRWARASKTDHFNLALYTCSGPKPSSSVLVIFSQKDQQLRHRKVISLPLWLENRFQIAI